MRDAVQIIRRAVQWVDYPGEFVRLVGFTVLLAKYAVMWVGLVQYFDDDRLGFALFQIGSQMQAMANMGLRAARQAGQIMLRAMDRLEGLQIEEKGRVRLPRSLKGRPIIGLGKPENQNHILN